MLHWIHLGSLIRAKISNEMKIFNTPTDFEVPGNTFTPHRLGGEVEGIAARNCSISVSIRVPNRPDFCQT